MPPSTSRTALFVVFAMNLLPAVIFVVLSAAVAVAEEEPEKPFVLPRVTYADVVATNRSCGAKDSCALRKTDRKMDLVDWRQRNCFCDANCADYGDCCVDSK